MNVKRWISAVVCAATLAGSMAVAGAAEYPTVEKGTSEEGVSYVLHYPKVYGMIDAKIAVINQSWNGDGERKEVELELPVVAAGDPFELEFTGGFTSARCPDCDKPLSQPSGGSSNSMANGTIYDGPCIVVMIGGDVYKINAENAAFADTFEWRGRTNNRLAQTDNFVELDYEEDSIGLRSITDLTIDQDDHFHFAPGNQYYDPNGDNSYGWANLSFQTGFYLRLPESTITQMDFSQTYTTKELEALINGEIPAAEPSDWAQAEIAAADAAGLIPELNGSPAWQSSASRLHFAQLAVRLAETVTGETLPAAPESTFADCTDVDVRKAYAAGIVNGTSDTTFSPEDKLTREQLATMLWRAASYIQQQTGEQVLTAGGSLEGYTDAGSVSDYATEAVATLANYGIMKGTSATALSPQQDCSVEQSALLCYRLYDHFAKA